MHTFLHVGRRNTANTHLRRITQRHRIVHSHQASSFRSKERVCLNAISWNPWDDGGCCSDCPSLGQARNGHLRKEDVAGQYMSASTSAFYTLKHTTMVPVTPHVVALVASWQISVQEAAHWSGLQKAVDIQHCFILFLCRCFPRTQLTRFFLRGRSTHSVDESLRARAGPKHLIIDSSFSLF